MVQKIAVKALSGAVRSLDSGAQSAKASPTWSSTLDLSDRCRHSLWREISCQVFTWLSLPFKHMPGGRIHNGECLNCPQDSA